jgi:hypothetical protein
MPPKLFRLLTGGVRNPTLRVSGMGRHASPSGPNRCLRRRVGDLEPLLPAAKPRGRPQEDLRQVFNAIRYLTRSGAQWRLRDSACLRGRAGGRLVLEQGRCRGCDGSEQTCVSGSPGALGTPHQTLGAADDLPCRRWATGKYSVDRLQASGADCALADLTSLLPDLPDTMPGGSLASTRHAFTRPWRRFSGSNARQLYAPSRRLSTERSSE